MTVEESTRDNIEGALEGEPWRMGQSMASGETPTSNVTGNSNSPSDSSSLAV